MENFMQALTDSVSGALGPVMGAIPKIFAFLAILIVGWILAGLIARGVTSLLRAVKFNDLSQRSGFNDLVQKMGMSADGANFIGVIAKWFVRLIALVVAFDALGLPAVSDIFNRFLMWLPNVAVAMVVLVIGGLAANALAALIHGSTEKAGLGNPTLLANSARVVVWAFAIVVAVNQIGIATNLVNILFTGTVGAVALALGLAFGLGSRDTAGEMVRRWYQKGQESAPRTKRAGKALEEEARHH